MAVTFLTGFESAAALVDNIVLTGTAAYSTTQARTGTRSIRCNPASGVQGYVSGITQAEYSHFGMYVASLPSLNRLIFGTITAGTPNVRLTSAGELAVYINTTLIGTSSAAFASTGWHWVGVRSLSGTSVAFLQIDGVDEVTGTGTVTSWSNVLGCYGSEASAIDVYFDDYIVDPAGFLAPSKVALLLPISDNYRDTLWTGGSGGTTNLYDAVNNCPPVGSATESNTTQIEHAGGAAATGDQYHANLTTYTNAGVGASDTVIALQGVVVWGEDVATGTKMLSWGAVSNPGTTIGVGSTDVSTGHGSGAVGTYSTGTDYWNESRSVVKTLGLVIDTDITLGTSPVMRVSRPETASRVASVCFMGMHVAWTPPNYTTISSSFAANAVIKKTLTPTFTANAANKKTQSGTFFIGNNDGTGGAVKVIAATTYTFTDKKADAVIKKTLASTFAANAVIKRTQTGSTTANSTLKRTQTGSTTVNATLKRTQTSSSTANAVLKRTQTGSTTANAVLKRTQAGSTTANATLEATTAQTTTANATLKRTQTGSTTVNAVLKRTQNPTSTVDAIRKRTFYFGSGPDPR